MAQDFAQTIKDGYTFSGAMLDVGRPIHDGKVFPDVPVGLPMAMMNRHGLIAGATIHGRGNPEIPPHPPDRERSRAGLVWTAEEEPAVVPKVACRDMLC